MMLALLRMIFCLSEYNSPFSEVNGKYYDGIVRCMVCCKNCVSLLAKRILRSLQEFIDNGDNKFDAS
jgi:hypothetical protein